MRALVGALTLLAVAAPAATARTVALDKDASSVQVAGGRVSWLLEGSGSSVRVRTVAPGAGAPATVATLQQPYPAGDANDASLATDATSWAVALRSGVSHAVDPDGYVEIKADRVVSGTWASPQTRTVVDCSPTGAPSTDDVPDLEVAYAASHLLLGGATCGPLTGLQDIPPPPAAPVRLEAPRTGFTPYDLRTHGGLAVGYFGGRVTVRDVSRGQNIGSIGAAGAFDVDDDATVITAPTGRSTARDLVATPLGAASGRTLVARGVQTDTTSESGLVAGGGNVLFEPAPAVARFGLAVVPVKGGQPLVVGAPGAGPPRTPLAVDATSATFSSFSCAGAPQVTVAGLPPDLSSPIGCPLRADATQAKVSRRTHTVRLPVSCPNGCTTTVGLYIPLKHKGIGAYVDKHDDNALATGKVSLGPGGSATVTLRLAKLARDFVKKAKGLTSDVGLDLGAVELTAPATVTLPARI